jgi:hypothetical protein
MDSFKKYLYQFFLLLCIVFIAFGTACQRKSGCPGEDAQVKVDKNGMPKSKAKSGLFDKKTMKKMGK